MSSIRWSENRLIESVGENEEELGRIKPEPDSGKYVLWLKDTFGLAGTAGTYIKADEYPSLEVAKSEALEAPSVFIWHLIWMRGVLKREAEKALEDKWEQFCADAPDLSALNKQNTKDRLRAHLDRLTSDKVKELFKEIGKAALIQAVIKLSMSFLNDQ